MDVLTKARRSEFQIRPMAREELDIAVEWAAAEGWNPGLHDAECFYAADPEGFLGGYLDGELIGCISAVNYGGQFGFVGFYIMKPEFRGIGNYGFALGNAAQKRLENVNLGLDGVVRQQPHYAKLWGCKLAHRNVRYELKSPRVLAETEPPGTVQIVPLENVAFEELAAYDRQVFLVGREPFLRLWTSRPGTVALGAMEGGRLCGYAVLRPCRAGYKLAPLFADSEEIAELLFSRLLCSAAPGPLYLDIPQVNQGALALVELYGMEAGFETARMYTKGDPGLPLDRIFGITSFELG